MKKIIGYHFVNDALRDGTKIPKDGVWLEHTGQIKMCSSGLHGSLSAFDALQYAPGNTLCLVEFGGEIIEGHDKLVARARKIIARFEADELLFKFARDCALSVVHFWDAPEVVLNYLKTGDKKLKAATRIKAYSAACREASSAACRAACRAASSAACIASSSAACRAASSAACRADLSLHKKRVRLLFDACVDAEFYHLGYDVPKMRKEISQQDESGQEEP